MIRIALVIAAAALLASCGKQGALQRPDPMFGKPVPAPSAPVTPAPEQAK